VTDIPSTQPAEPLAQPITGLPIETALTLWCPFVTAVAVPPVGGVPRMATSRGHKMAYGVPDADIQKAMNCIATRCMSWFPDSSAPTTHGTCRLITGTGVKA
jgi:hypothetical protein